MALELKPSSQWWYARFLVNGKLRRVNLGVKTEGKRPRSMTEEGDLSFERSRGKAMAAHEMVMKDVQSNKTAEELAQRVMEIKIGSRVESVPLKAIADTWAALPRKKAPSRQYMTTQCEKLDRFSAFIRRSYPGVSDLAEVQSEHIQTFLKSEEDRGVSARTWNIMLSLLKGVFRKLEPGADAYRRCLLQTPERTEDTVHRQPFTAEEISAVLDAAQSDALVRPLIVTAFCTAMRRGDCALLQWHNVDLSSNFITVRTNKTGETAEIPILPPLQKELELAAHRTDGNRTSFVFSAAAAVYRRNPRMLDRRLKSVLLHSGFVDETDLHRLQKRSKTGKPSELKELPQSEIQERGFKAIESMSMSENKRTTMREIFRSYLGGNGLSVVAKQLAISKSTVSLHLHEIEKATGASIIRWKAASLPERVRGTIHSNKGDTPRLKRGSLRGWHSFRTTFITLALSAGMPMELVRKITGHQSVDIVLKHYFKPGREQFRDALMKVMPAMLVDGHRSPKEEMREILANTSAISWKRDKERLEQLLCADQASGTPVIGKAING